MVVSVLFSSIPNSVECRPNASESIRRRGGFLMDDCEDFVTVNGLSVDSILLTAVYDKKKNAGNRTNLLS